uniref:E n=1 Tax=Bamboo rat arterivirus TaxID=3038165 RepID=A0AAT9TW58_9NIDO|nr:E [Bamboo rat arterivirus] [Bamboo rat arterivirus]WFD49962.1 E [Bamboo rat arterivirus] [Bamboo rat arterivirus]WFD49972.1 E [Bamboo rat arterivirus] [Bamboo rat arterivirus]
MGNISTLFYKAVEDAFTSLVVSIIDIVIYLAILFALSAAGWLLVFLLRLVLAACYRAASATKQSDLSKVL